MGYYTLTAPGVVVVGGEYRHYVTTPAQPIKVDDDEAAPQVQSGVLQPYPLKTQTGPSEPERAATPAPETEQAEAPRRRRRSDTAT